MTFPSCLQGPVVRNSPESQAGAHQVILQAERGWDHLADGLEGGCRSHAENCGQWEQR